MTAESWISARGEAPPGGDQVVKLIALAHERGTMPRCGPNRVRSCPSTPRPGLRLPRRLVPAADTICP
jgi:hypothetical protein